MARYRQPPKDLVDYTTDLERRVSKIERVPRAPTTTLDNGQLIFNGGTLMVLPATTGEPVFLAYGASDSFVNNSVQINRSKIGDQVGLQSTLAFMFLDQLIGFGLGGSINVYDRFGSPILSDAFSANAQGLGDPRFYVHFFDSSISKTITSGTFTNIASTFWYIYHPHLRVRTIVNTPVGTTGEIRVNENTLAQQAIFSIPSGANQYLDLIVDRRFCSNGRSPNGNIANLDLEARRTGGAGNVTVTFIEAIGIDLSFLW